MGTGIVECVEMPSHIRHVHPDTVDIEGMHLSRAYIYRATNSSESRMSGEATGIWCDHVADSAAWRQGGSAGRLPTARPLHPCAERISAPS